LKVAGLFAGVGGIELGLHRAGHRCVLLCERDPHARRVLKKRFHDVDLAEDVTTLRRLPKVDLLAAGFPCTDLSQVGPTNGINGSQSGLVKHVFRLVRPKATRPRWILLENVPFMLHLQDGAAIRYIIDKLESFGYTWAYRVVDTQAFGIPQRRRRVFLLAARDADPKNVLFADDAEELASVSTRNHSFGFYWTEGNRGLGWAIDSVPTMKGGSGLAIPSPPAIWQPRSGRIGTPDIRDAERLQGFPTGWTAPAGDGTRQAERHRWRLVGNAVSVPVAQWIGRRLSKPGEVDPSMFSERPLNGQWPTAAWGRKGQRFMLDCSSWPLTRKRKALFDFLCYPTHLLSARAAKGFHQRAVNSSLRINSQFLADVARHVRRMKRRGA